MTVGLVVVGVIAHAQGQAPAQGARHPAQPGASDPGDRISRSRLRVARGRREDSQTERLRQRQDSRHRLRMQSLSGVAAVREPNREALPGLSRTRGHVRRDQSQQSEIHPVERARLHRRDRFARRDEDSHGVPAHRVAVSLRRRNPGRLDQVRRRGNAAHLSIRSDRASFSTRGASTTTSAKSW